jgi:hypothetical protein
MGIVEGGLYAGSFLGEVGEAEFMVLDGKER